MNISSVKKADLIQKLFIRHADIELPEQRLWMAVLCRAIDDLMLGDRKNPADRMIVRHKRISARMFFERGQYAILCDWVGLDPAWVREVLSDHAGLEFN